MNSRTPLSTLLLVLLLLFFTAFLQAQTTIHVDDNAPGDPGPGDTAVSDPLEDGSAAQPFDAIQEGMDAAVYGDTVLVADGTYTGEGNRDMNFNGKRITVRSENGPGECVIDGEGSWNELHTAFLFDSGEGPYSILRGFTITRFENYATAGIDCQAASPTIIGNVITYINGGGINVNGSPRIIGNEITHNWSNYVYAAAIQIWDGSAPLIFNNLIDDNFTQEQYGAAISCYGDCRPLIVACTIVDNYNTGYASGIYGMDQSEITVIDSIVWGNYNEEIYANNISVTYSDVEGGFVGTGNIDLDPRFVGGPGGSYSLSQLAAGQGADSPCLDAGSDLASNICTPGPDGAICLGGLSTRTDRFRDGGQADMGYHRQGGTTLSVSLGSVPASGTLPFQASMFVELENRYPGITRWIAGKIHVTLAGGQSYAGWRTGFTQVGAGSSHLASWPQSIPALGSLVGVNRFTLVAEDVTPAPWNQPPYPPAGDTDTAACTVTGVAP